MTVGGAFGVILAAYVVKSLPLTVMKWVVCAVVLYTSASMFFSAAKKKLRMPDPEAGLFQALPTIALTVATGDYPCPALKAFDFDRDVVIIRVLGEQRPVERGGLQHDADLFCSGRQREFADSLCPFF